MFDFLAVLISNAFVTTVSFGTAAIVKVSVLKVCD